MRKMEEIRTADSCINKAEPNEMMFVLLARDAAAPATIRFWCEERVRLGLNLPTSDKIREAELTARIMERERVTRA